MGQKTFALTVVTLLLSCEEARALIVSEDTVVDGDFGDPDVELDWGVTLTLVEGANIPGDILYWQSSNDYTVIVRAGRVGGSIYGAPGSEVQVDGGTIAGEIDTLQGGMAIRGGTIGAIDLHDSDLVHMYGGSVGEARLDWGGLHLHGGTIGAVDVGSGSSFLMSGGRIAGDIDAREPDNALEFRGGMLGGSLLLGLGKVARFVGYAVTYDRDRNRIVGILEDGSDLEDGVSIVQDPEFPTEIQIESLDPGFRLVSPAEPLSVAGSASVDVHLTSFCEVEGISLGVRHDPRAVEPRAVGPAGPLAELRSGEGPEFWQVSFDPGLESCPEGPAAGTVIVAIGSTTDPGTARLPVLDDLAVATIRYEAAPAGGGRMTALEFADCLRTGPDREPVPTALTCKGSAIATTDRGATLQVLESPFRRGDANGDAFFDIADPITTLLWLFDAGRLPRPPRCLDAHDVNDDGSVGLADATTSLHWLFSRGPLPHEPHPECGPDPTRDDLRCGGYGACR